MKRERRVKRRRGGAEGSRTEHEPSCEDEDPAEKDKDGPSSSRHKVRTPLEENAVCRSVSCTGRSVRSFADTHLESLEATKDTRCETSAVSSHAVCWLPPAGYRRVREESGWESLRRRRRGGGNLRWLIFLCFLSSQGKLGHRYFNTFYQFILYRRPSEQDLTRPLRQDQTDGLLRSL
jgi:hypothetical protein